MEMFNPLAKASILKVIALSGALSWNQPLGCHQLGGLGLGPYHVPGQDPALGTVIDDEQLELDVLVASLAAERIRLYGCDAVLDRAARKAKALPEAFRPEVALGAWISSDFAANRRQIECVIRVCGEGLCDLAVVGNEVLLRGDVDEATLLGYLELVRAALPGVPVTTGEDQNVLLAHPRVMDASDVVLAHLYPFWGGVSIEHAMAALRDGYAALRDAAGSKLVVIGETGWPSCGEPNGQAIPGPENASRYLREFVEWSRSEDVIGFYFSTFDEPWKVQHEGERGRCWGLFEENYAIKPGVEVVFDEEFPSSANGVR